MNIEAANNWPLMVVPLAKETALQNESPPPTPTQNRQSPTIPNKGLNLESNKFRAKGSIIDIYI